MQNILSKHLEKISKNSESEAEKGRHFEKIAKLYLEKDKTQAYDKVWHYKDWAKEQGLSERDTGIDLVANHTDGRGFCAIQCKFYESKTRLNQNMLSSFIAHAGSGEFASFVIVDTTTLAFSDNLEDLLSKHERYSHRVTISELDKSNIEWDAYITEGKIEIKDGKTPRDDQQTAIDAVITKFKTEDRGKMIMACGTGKTFTSLRIAEDMGGAGKTVLYMVPSLALMSQTVREWKYDARGEFNAFSVCSDVQVGRHTDDDVIDLRPSELAFPATTNAKKLAEQVKNAPKDKMIVIFSTYQSIEVLTKAQKLGLPAFDLIICDEAHRTTGATLANEPESHFVQIHDNAYVNGKNRLYMTATPKIFGEKARATAKEHSIVLASMDDEALFGRVFYQNTFAWAVENDLLTDYKVIVLAVDEGLISARVQTRLAEENELKLDDATKIIGCHRALTKHDILDNEDAETPLPMKRAVAFCRGIDISKDIGSEFSNIVDEYLEHEEHPDNPETKLNVELKHVDGTYNAKRRDKRLSWLKDDTDSQTCRILTNARCLSEGVDVPALDAIMFMHPRNSQIDVVQSVGRVMRKAEGKKMGYVILPVAVPAGIDPADSLDDNERYRVVWQILNALRTHDERLAGTINQISLGEDVSDKIQIIGIRKDVMANVAEVNTLNVSKKKKPKKDLGGGGGGKRDDEINVEVPEEDSGQGSFEFELAHAIRAKIVEKCGTREYWDTWARDIGDIAQKHITRIRGIIGTDSPAKTAFDAFLTEIRDDLNPEITPEDAVEMLAQHLITKPVFDTLFKDNEFTANNPVSKAMETVLTQLDQHNLEKESESLKGFYASVARRAKGIKTAEGRQTLVVELYDKFFRTAFPTLTQKLGIVYTPVEVVDFIIHSVNDVLKSEFKTDLGAEGVHILDPFTGTGTFITRLLQSGLITPAQMEYKYKNEIHANEIVLLAYYIAAINIESVYRDSMIGSADDGAVLPYAPFDGIVLTDTFQLYEQEKDMVADLMPDNSERRTKQKARDIRVIMGNPPYSAGQQNANDDAKNVDYPNLDKQITNSYAKHSTAKLKTALYDSYIRAFRWATDRITDTGNDAGVVAFVSGAGWVDRSFADGLRKSLAEDFSSLYVFHLRGDIRKNILSGGVAKEGENIFGSGSMTGIAISILVRDPKAKKFGKIHFHDIGDDLTIKQKQAIINQLKSIDGITTKDGWQNVQPDKHHDWINQRDPSFENHIAIGNKKDKKAITIFTNYSSGVKTNRDFWCYNSSKKALSKNMSSMINCYNGQVQLRTENPIKFSPTRDEKLISWDGTLESDLKDLASGVFSDSKIALANYRPFHKQWFYFDKQFNNSVYHIPKFFPKNSINNRVIAISGVGARAGFSFLMTSQIPNVHLIDTGQNFPLKFYEASETEAGLWNSNTANYTEKDGISDKGLAHFQAAYPSESITKEDLFYYIYGLLHSPEYRNRFKNNLLKELPRIPAVKTFTDFQAFSRAGRELGDLHVNYEEAELHPITIKQGDLQMANITDAVAYFRIAKKMKFGKNGKNNDKTTVIYNSNITITNIPLLAYEYIVNGKSALEWVMNRQIVKQDKASGIINDANDYANETMQNPAYPLQLFQRVITVSLKTMEIIDNLPDLDID